MIGWCAYNKVELNDSHPKTPLRPLSLNGAEIEQIESFRFLGTKISRDPSCGKNTVCITRKAQQRLNFLRQLRRFGIAQEIMIHFCRAIFESLAGGVGFLMRFIGPITIAPTIILIGLSLSGVVADLCAMQWWIAIMTTCLLGIFSQLLNKVRIPCTKRLRGIAGDQKWPLFQLYAVVTAWAICGILTASGALPSTPSGWGYGARTDAHIANLNEAPWFRIPYPGIFIEGIGCLISGLCGTGIGSTSYSQHIGEIGLTKVGSRRVVQVGAFIMVIAAMFGKVGALLGTIPSPVIGGVLLVMMGMVCTVGISNLRTVDLNSSRNLFIIGVSLFTGITVPQWVSTHTDSIDLGNAAVSQAAIILLRTSMIVGGVIAFILDNAIPGTLEERGMCRQSGSAAVDEAKQDETSFQQKDSDENIATYDMPFGMAVIRRLEWLRYVPISPTYGRHAGDSSPDTVTELQSNEGHSHIERTVP
ncbi:Solute carrier family 23 member 1 [Lamellibrachia satsuma]|nr:Solute carrier family 23 member 1 [Lamellibrachia satsuma]